MAAWLGDYANKMPAAGAACKMSTADIKIQQALANDLITEMANATSAQANSKKVTATKNAQKFDSLAGIRSNIAFLKANPNWTSAMAQDLQTEGVPNIPDPATYKAKLSGSVNGGAVQLRFLKAGVHSVNVYTRTVSAQLLLFLNVLAVALTQTKGHLQRPALPKYANTKPWVLLLIKKLACQVIFSLLILVDNSLRSV